MIDDEFQLEFNSPENESSLPAAANHQFIISILRFILVAFLFDERKLNIFLVFSSSQFMHSMTCRNA